MGKSPHNGVHGRLNTAFGLTQVFPFHTGSFKLRIGVQELLRGRQVVVQKGINFSPFGRVRLYCLENTGSDGLQLVNLGRECLIGNAVIGIAYLLQDHIVVRHRLLLGRLLPGCFLLLFFFAQGFICLRTAEKISQFQIQIRRLPKISFVDHLLQVFFHPIPGMPQGPGQLVNGQCLPVSHDGQILMITPQAPLHGHTAHQHGNTGYHTGQRCQQALDIPPIQLTQPDHHIDGLPAGQKAHHGNDHSDNLEHPSSGGLCRRRLCHSLRCRLSPVPPFYRCHRPGPSLLYRCGNASSRFLLLKRRRHPPLLPILAKELK